MRAAAAGQLCRDVATGDDRQLPIWRKANHQVESLVADGLVALGTVEWPQENGDVLRFWLPTDAGWAALGVEARGAVRAAP